MWYSLQEYQTKTLLCKSDYSNYQLYLLLITTPMKLSQLVQEHNLTCSTTHICPDWLAQYVGGEKLSTVITKNGVIVKILDDHAGLLKII